MTKTCQNCGVEFTQTFPNQKYCGKECADIVLKEKNRIYRREYREKHKNTKKAKEKATSYEFLENINKGIQTGQYHGTPGMNLDINRLKRNGGKWK